MSVFRATEDSDALRDMPTDCGELIGASRGPESRGWFARGEDDPQVQKRGQSLKQGMNPKPRSTKSAPLKI